MLVFTTAHPRSSYYLIKEGLLSLCFAGFVLLVGFFLFPDVKSHGGLYIVVPTIFVMYLLDQLRTDRLYELCIDETQHQLIFRYKRFWSEPKQKILPFEEARVVIHKRNGWRMRLLGETSVLYFMQDRKEIFMLGKNKDGFSLNTLKEIRMALEKLSLAVKKR